MTVQTSDRTGNKACPFVVGRLCLAEDCMAWEAGRCNLVCMAPQEITSPFEQKLRSTAPLMYRSLSDLVRIMEEFSNDCQKCGPDLWNYAQVVRTSLLDELTRAELAEVGIRSENDRK